MKIEAPQFIGKTVDSLRQRAVSRRNAIDDAGLVSQVILLGALAEGAITGNVGIAIAAVLMYPADLLTFDGIIKMAYKIRDYNHR